MPVVIDTITTPVTSTTVTNTVRRPDGTLATGRVTIDLVGTNGVTIVGYVTASDYAVEGTHSFDLVNGTWSVPLVANSLISPTGTRWRLVESVDGRFSEPRYLLVPDGPGPYIVEDILDEAPGSLASPALGVHVDALDPHPGYVLESTLGIFAGTGSPEGVVTAGVGAIFQRTDGAAGTCLYVKESGTGNTGWVAK